MQRANAPLSQPKYRLQFSLKALLLLMVVASVAVAYYSNRPIELNSSSIRSVHYNHWTGMLLVKFQSGDTYQYLKVPRETYNGLLRSESHGKYFHKHFRNSDFEFEKLEE